MQHQQLVVSNCVIESRLCDVTKPWSWNLNYKDCRDIRTDGRIETEVEEADGFFSNGQNRYQVVNVKLRCPTS